MSETIIIAGAGHAAGQAAASLRQKKFAGRIVMIGEEAYVPYQRPPLSKKFLAGELETERLFFKPADFYPQHDIELRLRTRVAAIDPAGKSVRLEDGEIIDYSKLLLTTGSRVRRLQVPGNELSGVHYLRNIDDVLAIRPHFQPGKRLVVVGAGYIGLEVAAIAVTHGLDVTVLETESRVMSRVMAPAVSAFFEQLHRDAGVKIEFGRTVKEFRGENQVAEVVCADGYSVAADLCIVGIGILPNAELAEAAGLECNNGIVVDEYARTTDADIYAAGDCTHHPNALLGTSLRLESVHNALEQAKTAAASMCGERLPYAQIPWFWSDQYDVKLQIVGLGNDYDNLVIRGDQASKSFAAFYLRGNRLLAVDAVNSPREFMLGKKLIAAGAEFDPQTLADESVDFKALATRALDNANLSG